MKRALDSYVQSAKKHARTLEFVVMDDSSSSAYRQTNKLALKKLRSSLGVAVRYAGFEERERFGKELAAEGFDPELIAFGLLGDRALGVTTGANRNAFLLDSIDELGFMADDDTLCRAAAPPQIQTGLALGSGHTPMEHWFFEDREKTMAGVAFTENDLLQFHEDFLGRTVDDCVVQWAHSSRVDFSGSSKEVLKGIIRTSFNGYLGDSAVSPFLYLTLDGPSRDRLLESETIYRKAIGTMESCRAPEKAYLVRDPYCMTAFMGFDHRATLPPFSPSGRVQDSVFGALLWKCYPDAVSAQLPWCAPHTPLQAREYPDDSARKASVKANNVLKWAVEEGQAATVKEMGSYLMEAAGRSSEEFEKWGRDLIRRRAEERAVLLQQALTHFDAQPRYWADDARACLADWKRIAGEPVIDDAPKGWPALHVYFHKFGRLLRAWPNMEQAARELKKKDVRVSRPLADR